MKDVPRSCREWDRGCKVAGSALNVDGAVELDVWQSLELEVVVLGIVEERLGR